MDKISIIVPCYNEEDVVELFWEALSKELQKEWCRDIEFEVLFVDDGSKDLTLKKVRKLENVDRRIKYLSFSRNFGKEAAIYAGLKNVQGDIIVIMDVDLQDPPELLKDMYSGIIEEGYDCVATRRRDRKGEPPIRSWFAKRFYKIINRYSDVEIEDGARDFRMMKRPLVDAILSMNEYNRFSKGIFGWIGFNTKWIEYNNIERVAGKTKWSFVKLFKYAFEGVTSFSAFPLIFAMYAGIILSIISFVMMLVVIARRLIYGDPVAGWASLVCIMLFMGGIETFILGIIGQYIAKMYLEVKNRPLYVVKESSFKINI